MPKKSTISLKGSKNGDYILTISDNYGYRDDLALTYEELLDLKKLLNKKIK